MKDRKLREAMWFEMMHIYPIRFVYVRSQSTGTPVGIPVTRCSELRRDGPSVTVHSIV